jgi:hypothetical protein
MEAPLIEPALLLRDLDATWRSLGKSDAGVLRACAMTIVTIARPADDPQELGEIIAGLMHDYPCRAIVLRLHPGPADFSARATVQCWMPHGRRSQICSEQLDLEAPSGRAPLLAPVLRALLVPDLPVVFWCRDLLLAAQPALQPLYSLAGRLIVDSVPVPDARAAFDALLALRAHRKPVSDLAWTRVTRWRALLENVFQTPACRARLLQLQHAAIAWSGQGTPAVACYLAAWLKSHFPEIQLDLSCNSPEFPPPGTGRIRRLTLSGDGFAVEIHRPAGTLVNVRGAGLDTTMLFPLFSEADVLREELALPGHDPLYEAALPEALRLA